MERQEIQRGNRLSNIILQVGHVSTLKQKQTKNPPQNPKELTSPQLHMKKQSIKKIVEINDSKAFYILKFGFNTTKYMSCHATAVPHANDNCLFTPHSILQTYTLPALPKGCL